MWKIGGLGSVLGQIHHFAKYNKGKSEHGEQRYSNEERRLKRVLNERLEGRDYIAGDGRGMYSIANMACRLCASRFEWQKIDLNAFPNVRGWYVRIVEHPAVQRGYFIPKFTSEVPMP